METLKHESPSKMKEASFDVKGGLRKLENSLEKTTHDAGVKIGSMAAQFTDSASGYINTSRDYVKENPAKGVAIAAATGLVAGSLLTMVLRKRS